MQTEADNNKLRAIRVKTGCQPLTRYTGEHGRPRSGICCPECSSPSGVLRARRSGFVYVRYCQCPVCGARWRMEVVG
jgi:hypothetical protein|nr:MAG TPA: RNA polymerase-like protein [Caudoviricetes sp.]